LSATRVDSEIEFRRALHEFEPDLILSAYSLPHFDAMNALTIKRQILPRIPFIVVTRPTNEELAVGCIKAGADDYLLKDRLTRLASAVRSALEKKQARSERERAEQRLRVNEQRFRALIENSSDGIALISKDATVLFASASTRRLLGYPAEELVGRDPLELMHPHDLASARKCLHELLRRPGRTISRQLRCKHRDGSWRWIEVTGKNLLAEPSVQAIVTNYRDVTERHEVQELIKTALRQKEALLKETHHRVKNNLQVISSLLQLSSAAIKDPQCLEVLRESQGRIKSMALIHERLYRSDQLSRIDLAEYLRGLVSEMFRSYQVDPQAVSFRVEAEELVVGPDTGIPCGLIVHELVTNSLKHAFTQLPTNGKSGRVEISLLPQDRDCAILIVRDNGVGLPEHVYFAARDLRVFTWLKLWLTNSEEPWKSGPRTALSSDLLSRSLKSEPWHEWTRTAAGSKLQGLRSYYLDRPRGIVWKGR
jgi:PAS domain S-box-containing protein